MKKRLFTILFAFATLCGFAQDVEPADACYYEIMGELRNVPDSTVIRLLRIDGNVGRSFANDTIIDGRFHFWINPVSSKEELSLICFPCKDFPAMELRLWASPGDKVKVTGENTLIFTWKVEGGPQENISWQAYLNDSRELWNQTQRNSILVNELRIQARNLSEEEKITIRQKIDSLLKDDEMLTGQIYSNEIRRMKKSAVDAIWMKKLNVLAMEVKYRKNFPYRKEVIALYNSLSGEQKQHKLAQEAHAMLFPPQQVEVGKEMADAELLDLEGNCHSLAELKGKYILIDFWSSGCGPCIMAIPEMEELATTYKDKLNIVSISIDNKDTWDMASEEHRMSWNNWNDHKGQSGIYSRYDLGVIPNYTLISPEGIVLEQWTGYGEGSLKQKIGEYIDKE